MRVVIPSYVVLYLETCLDPTGLCKRSGQFVVLDVTSPGSVIVSISFTLCMVPSSYYFLVVYFCLALLSFPPSILRSSGTESICHYVRYETSFNNALHYWRRGKLPSYSLEVVSSLTAVVWSEGGKGDARWVSTECINIACVLTQ